MASALMGFYLRRAKLASRIAEATLFWMALVVDVFGAIGLIIWLMA